MNRTAVIADALSSRGVEGLLVSDIRNVRYLSGFTGSSGFIVVTRGENVFITDSRYHEQASREIRNFSVLIEKDEHPRLIIETARRLGVSVLGFEPTVSYSFYRSLLKKGLRVKAVGNLVEDMRKTKDSAEIGLISEAVERAQRAFESVRPFIKTGTTEICIASRLEDELKKNGCARPAFDIIVAAGNNSCMPHAKPTGYKIKPGDFVVVDWGGECGGYFSDMTRTLLMRGRNVSKKREIYELVLKANRAARSAVSEGVPAKNVDKAARDIIRSGGYGEFFGHGTGHGIGLEVHELPRVSRLARETVKAGMIFTVEPGIYVPGLGGVRIEDMVLAASGGCRTLTTLPEEFEMI